MKQRMVLCHPQNPNRMARMQDMLRMTSPEHVEQRINPKQATTAGAIKIKVAEQVGEAAGSSLPYIVK